MRAAWRRVKGREGEGPSSSVERKVKISVRPWYGVQERERKKRERGRWKGVGEAVSQVL